MQKGTGSYLLESGFILTLKQDGSLPKNEFWQFKQALRSRAGLQVEGKEAIITVMGFKGSEQVQVPEKMRRHLTEVAHHHCVRIRFCDKISRFPRLQVFA